MHTLSGMQPLITSSLLGHRTGRVLCKGSLLAKAGKCCRMVYGAFLAGLLPEGYACV